MGVFLSAVYFNIVKIFFFQIQLCFPEEGLVYDYRLDDGLGNQDGDDEDEEGKVKEILHGCQIKLSGAFLLSQSFVLYCRCSGSAG